VETTKRRRIFRDVVRGFSESTLNSEKVFVKHLTPHDQVELEEIEERYFNIAKNKGVPTEEDMLAMLAEENQWTEKDQKIIEEKKEFIKSLSTAKNKLVLKSEIDQQQDLIDKENKLLRDKELQKKSLIGNTCEKYAKDRMNDFYMIKSFFYDRELNKPYFDDGRFDDMQDYEISDVVLLYNSIFENFSEESIQHTVLEDFYSPYLSFAEDSMQFYGKPFCELTYNQIRLIVYTRVFKNIFDYNDNIPDHIKSDPKKLLEFGGSSREEKDKAVQKLQTGDAATLVGAKKEDYEYLGVKEKTKGVDLHEEVKKKGGSLNMEDLMKLHGVE